MRAARTLRSPNSTGGTIAGVPYDGHTHSIGTHGHITKSNNGFRCRHRLIEVALDDPDVPVATRNLGETLLEVNRRSERLIDGLLVLAKGEQRLDTYAKVDLADVAHRAITTAAPAAQKEGIRIKSDLLHAYVIGDPALLEQLAQNLVDNAIRYNIAERGWVHVSIIGDARYSRISVLNTGPVIAPIEVDGLFEPFRRLPSSERITDGGRAASSRGAGLGLSIVRSVANAHGGDVRAAARPEGGLVVTVTLPFRQ